MEISGKRTKTLAERADRAVAAAFGDLCLFFQLCVARILVWYTLRQRDRAWAKGHAERRKQFRRAAVDRDADGGAAARRYAPLPRQVGR